MPKLKEEDTICKAIENEDLELFDRIRPLLHNFPKSLIEGREFLVPAIELARLVTEKNNAYGDSYSKAKDFLKILYPEGVPVDSYHDMLILVRLFDKMMRIATDRDALGESPYRDVAGYAIVELTRQREEETKASEDQAGLSDALDQYVSQIPDEWKP